MWVLFAAAKNVLIGNDMLPKIREILKRNGNGYFSQNEYVGIEKCFQDSKNWRYI